MSENLTVILNNTIKAFNSSHKVKLEYGSTGGSKNALKIQGEYSNSRSILCTKSQAIDIIDFIRNYQESLKA